MAAHPNMKRLLFLFFVIPPVWAQSPSAPAQPVWANLPDTTVIATVDDQPLTLGQFKAFTSFLDPASQAKLMVDPTELVRELAMMRKLASIALENKLDQQSPVREQLEYNRLVMLSQAAAGYLLGSATVEQNEILNYYNANRELFKQVKVKAIYIPFSATPGTTSGGKKALSEADAKAKAEKLVAAIKGGADFVKLVRENSEDETSKARDGDFATVTPADNIPDAMRAAVFQLKEGETSNPVRQANGFYILRAEQVTYEPLSQVRDQIFSKLKQEKGRQSLDAIHRDVNVQFPNSAFPGKPAAPPAGK